MASRRALIIDSQEQDVQNDLYCNPQDCQRIILKCLKKDPKERFADAGILKEIILEAFPQFGKNT